MGALEEQLPHFWETMRGGHDTSKGSYTSDEKDCKQTLMLLPWTLVESVFPLLDVNSIVS